MKAYTFFASSVWEWRKRTREKFSSTVKILIHCKYNSMPISSWYWSHICIILSPFTKLFYMIHWIPKIISWNTINEVISLVSQMRKLTEVKLLTHVWILESKGKFRTRFSDFLLNILSTIQIWFSNKWNNYS